MATSAEDLFKLLSYQHKLEVQYTPTSAASSPLMFQDSLSSDLSHSKSPKPGSESPKIPIYGLTPGYSRPSGGAMFSRSGATVRVLSPLSNLSDHVMTKYDEILIEEGTPLTFHVDRSQPEDSIDYRWTETHYDGAGNFAIPLHWHKYHDEHLEVLEGRVEITVGEKTWIADSSNGVMIAPKRTVHGINFQKGVKTILKERTNPTGRFKEAFFRDLLGKPDGGFLNAMRAFYDGDTYLPTPGGVRFVDQVYITIAGGIAKLFVPAKPALPPEKA